MTSDNPESLGMDDYLSQFTPMDEVDMTPRLDLRATSLHINGVEFERGGNSYDRNTATECVTRFPDLYAGSQTILAIRKELVDRGIIGLTEDHGFARGIEGQIVEGNVTYFTHPDVSAGMMLDGCIDGEVLEYLGGQVYGVGSSPQVKSKIEYDTPSIRAAMDAVLERPEFASEAAIATAHRQRVLTDPRLRGVATQAVIEAGGVPDPADPSYLDYI